MRNRAGYFAAVLFAIGVFTAVSSLAALVEAADRPSRSVLIIDTTRAPVRFEVEVVADEAARSRGLMYRKQLGRNAGMLFEFPDDDYRVFWMKNTILPLDMLFIRKDGTVSSIAADTTPYSESPISSTEPVRAVLEINSGRAAALGIVPGSRVHGSFFAGGRDKP